MVIREFKIVALGIVVLGRTHVLSDEAQGRIKGG